MINRLWKRKDRLAEVILKISKPIYYTLWQYNNRENKHIKIVLWEKIKNLKLEMDDMDSQEAKDFYACLITEEYIKGEL